jgi:WD40 repeat protein
VWLDTDSLKPGSNITGEVIKGLHDSRLLVACLSERAIRSEWTAFERQLFLFPNPRNEGGRLIPILLDNIALPPEISMFSAVRLYDSKKREHELERLVQYCRQPLGSESGAPGTAAVLPRVTALSPNKRLILFSNDENLQLRGVTRRARAYQLVGHEGQVEAIAWGPRGDQAASGSRDRTIRVWDITKRECVHVLKGHRGRVLCLAFSTDQKQLLSGSRDKTLRLWQLDSEKGQLLAPHPDSVTCLAWSADQRFALTGSNDGLVRLWNLKSDRCLAVCRGHKAAVRMVRWSTRGRAISSDAIGGARSWTFPEVHGA